jgi:lipopolysaccharide transport system ATP-binding protein
MSENAIVVENLSKHYLIGHQFTSGGSHNTTFRDMIGREVRNFARKAADVFHGRQVIQGDQIEDFWALKDVSFEVKHGEVLGIIGRNGAGKSTLLKILSRITEPTTGRALLSGRVGSLLEVGTGFHFELTGRENIFLNGAILGMTRREIDRKFDEIVAFADLEKFLDTPVKRYSSGMFVRLAFSVAAHLDPEILIVDEVLAVGDSEFQKKCLGKMNNISRDQGRTVLFVSHNPAALRQLCTHGVVLRNGTASAKYDINSALDDYASEQQTPFGSSNWRRPSNLPKPPVHFVSIDVHLEGRQPNHILKCCALIASGPGGSKASIAVQFSKGIFGEVIMEAVPKWEAFIGGTLGMYRVELSIELPPLIPGYYFMDFWLGQHEVDTFDWIRPAVAFEIVESPNPTRRLPHRRDRGAIAAVSTADISKVDVSRISIHDELNFSN